MKPLSFRALILGVLAPVLALMTAGWGWLVYGSIYDIIIGGFDRKLLAITGSVSALLDRAGHEEYQQRREVISLCASPDGGLVGVDGMRGEWVRIDVETGAARTIARTVEPLGKHLAHDPRTGLVWASDAAGRRLFEIDAASAQVQRTVCLQESVDGVFVREEGLMVWRGKQVCRVNETTGAPVDGGYAFPAIPSAVLWDTTAKRHLLLTDGGKTLIETDARGAYQGSHPVRLATPEGETLIGVKSLARKGARYFAAWDSLLEIDPGSGKCKAGSYTKSYFDKQHPFYVRYREPFMFMRKACKLTYLYTSVYLGGMDLYYVLDGTEGEKYSPPGATDTIPTMEAVLADLQVQYLGKSYVSKVQQWEQWGLVKASAYPIVDDGGKTVAIAGADVDMTTIRGKTRWALFAALFVGACSLAGAVVISVKVAQRLTQPLLALKLRALRIAAGECEAKETSRGDEEMARLSGVLDGLSVRLSQYREHSQRYRKDLHTVRRQSTLVRALDELISKMGTVERRGAGGKGSLHGACWSGRNGMIWMSSEPPTDIEVASISSRLTCLGCCILRAAGPGEVALAEYLAAASELAAVAVWDADSRMLRYSARQPSVLRVGDKHHHVRGSGSLEVDEGVRFEWASGDTASAEASAVQERNGA